MKKHLWLMAAVFLIGGLCGFASSAWAENRGPSGEESVWVTMGEDVFSQLVKHPEVLSDPMPTKAMASDSGVVVTRFLNRDLLRISRFVHAKANRCAGFVVHNSFEEAVQTLESARRGSYKALTKSFTVDQQTLVNQLLPDVTASNIYDTIEHLSTQYNNRYYLNNTGEQSALWIRDLWQQYAGARSDVTVTTYSHSGYIQPSVILTIQGATLPNEVVVLGGHLDSIKSGATNTDPATVAPGADDNASGIAALSEAIRVLMANGVVPDRTIKFMGYAAEEVGLRGSGDIAQDHQDAGTNVISVLQLDMTGFNGSVQDIALIDDYTNAELSAFVGNLVDTYQPTLQWTYSTCGYGCSDHASWHNRGYPAAMPFEARFGDHNSAIHTSNDTLQTLGNTADHAVKFSKLAVSFAVETAMAACSPPAVADAGPDVMVNEGNSVLIGTPAQAGNSYSWSPGGATTAQVSVSPTSTTTYTVTSTTSCGSAQDSTTVTVIPAGSNGPQTAAFDVGLGVPACAVAGSSCDSVGLLDGRGSVGPEANASNTLDGCTDGNSGSYHGDESIDRMVVSSLDSSDFVEGATVRIDTTVWAYSTGSSDTLDLYYAADASNPAWVLIDSIVPSGGGEQTISANYNLPAGSLQAIRANFRYQGSPSTCGSGNYDDTDDLVFAVGTAGPECVVNADCADGAYCNGAEVCNGGSCESGTAPTCDDGVSCTVDTCNESTDACDFTTDDNACDNGLFCDGGETCDAVLGCQVGTAPNCDDGVSCTVDACDEGSDGCANTPDHGVCANGLFCDGTETCDPVLGCQGGTDPCLGGACDEAGDVCLECTLDADCDDGLFCNGAETCLGGTCQGGSDPCPGQTCNESTDVCESAQPVTVTFTSIAGDDGWVRESNETSNVGGSSSATGSGSRPIRPGDAGQDRQYKSILSFDTSTIPAGATIQSATLRLRRGTVRGSNPFTSGFGQCLIDIQSGGFSGSTALQASDFQAVATATAVGSLSNAMSNGDWSEGGLNSAGLSAINTSGITQARIYFEVDDNDDGGDDHMGYYSGNHSSASNHPQLVVTYIP